MKKIFVCLVIGMVLLMNINVLASSEVSLVGENVEKYVKDFVEKKGIDKEDVTNIEEIDFEELPKEVNIENVGDHNLAIYEVDYQEDTKAETVFMVSYSVNELKAQGDLIVAQDKRMFLDFGSVGESSGSQFLITSTGVESSLEKGYVMVREGSITGLSTNMEIVETGSLDLEILIYINGELVGFRNSLNTKKEGVVEDYDVQAKGIVTFEPGDVISLEVNIEGNKANEIVWKDVISMVEITTTN